MPAPEHREQRRFTSPAHPATACAVVKVLLVDDTAFMRLRQAKVLTENGYEVAQAENGHDAVAKYVDWQPDAVLLDLSMPQMDGLAALKAIRKLDPDARVAVVSAPGQQAVVMEALRAGARDFVLKPFRAACVLTAVRKLLAN